MPTTPPVLLAVSLKLYFDHEHTVSWCRAVRTLLDDRPPPDGTVELVVLPTFISLPAAAEIFRGTGVALGGQDLFWEDAGPFTGEVSGPSLRQIGCRYAEVGHAERRRIFREDARVFAAKTLAAVRSGLTPIVCVGEREQVSAPEAAAYCIGQLDRIVAALRQSGLHAPLVIAYEPEWAIGAGRPAPVRHIGSVCGLLGQWLRTQPPFAAGRVIYGGTAGTGLYAELAGRVDGLFLGRAAHDPATLDAIIGEAVAVGRQT